MKKACKSIGQFQYFFKWFLRKLANPKERSGLSLHLQHKSIYNQQKWLQLQSLGSPRFGATSAQAVLAVSTQQKASFERGKEHGHGLSGPSSHSFTKAGPSWPSCHRRFHLSVLLPRRLNFQQRNFESHIRAIAVTRDLLAFVSQKGLVTGKSHPPLDFAESEGHSNILSASVLEAQAI